MYYNLTEVAVHSLLRLIRNLHFLLVLLLFSPFFPQAATCYRAAGEENQALAMFITAGECQSHESVAAPASAAKDFREAALITERQGR